MWAPSGVRRRQLLVDRLMMFPLGTAKKPAKYILYYNPEGAIEAVLAPLYFEDFKPGMVFDSSLSGSLSPRAIFSKKRVEEFAVVTGDKNLLHTDPEFAKTTILKDVVVHGRLAGLDKLFGLLDKIGFWSGSLEALTSDNTNYFAPVYPNRDWIRYALDVVETKEVEKYPDKGIVKFHFFSTNQKGKRVSEGNFTVMLRRREFYPVIPKVSR